MPCAAISTCTESCQPGSFDSRCPETWVGSASGGHRAGRPCWTGRSHLRSTDEPLRHLQLGLLPTDRVQMPRHSTFPRPPCTWCNVDEESRLDHAKIRKASKSLLQLPLESRNIDGRCIMLRATGDMGHAATGNEMQTFMVMRAPVRFSSRKTRSRSIGRSGRNQPGRRVRPKWPDGRSPGMGEMTPNPNQPFWNSRNRGFSAA
jgi:hypothetical protein